MAKRPREIYYLTEEGISELRSTVPFSNMTEQSQEMLEEFLQTTLGGMNRVEKRLLGTRLDKARFLLSLDEQSALWPQLKTEIENVLIMETPPPALST
jgi:DNA-binding PadR family transcriptional regulator